MSAPPPSDSLWESILSQSSQTSNFVASKHLLVLGCRGSGKSSVIHELMKGETGENLASAPIPPGFGLEYTYYQLTDPHTEDALGRLNIWTVEGEEGHSHLCKFGVDKTTLPHSAAVIIVDLSRPWDLLTSLKRWLAVIDNHVSGLDLGEDREKMEDTLIARYQNYKEPEEVSGGKLMDKSHLPYPVPSKETLLSLPPGALSHNLAIPVVIACTKSDSLEALSIEHDFKENKHTFMLYHLRKLCLEYGMGLVFLSTKTGKNCTVLKDYIEHIAFHKPLTHKPELIEKDSVFVPAGWDSEAKVELDLKNLPPLTQESIPNSELEYNKVITDPEEDKGKNESGAEVKAEEDQSFLARQMKEYGAATSTPSQSDARVLSSILSPASITSTPTRASTSSSSSSSFNTPVRKTPAQLEGSAKPSPQQNDHQMLADFFNSLLQKSPRVGGAGGAAPTGQQPPMDPSSAAAKLAALRK